MKENETGFSCNHITQIAATRSLFLIQAQATWMSLRDEQRVERMKQRKRVGHAGRDRDEQRKGILLQGEQMKGFLQLRGGEKMAVRGRFG